MPARTPRRVASLFLAIFGVSAVAFPAGLGQAAQAPPAPSGAPGAIHGVVTTQATIPLGGVMVALFNGTAEVTHLLSEGDGTFQFSGLRPGRYTVTAAFEGFESLTMPAVVGAGRTTEVPLDLRLAVTAHVEVVAGVADAIVPPAGTLSAGDTVDKKEADELSADGSVQSTLKLIAGVIQVPGGLSIKGGRPSQAGMQLGPGMFVDASTGISQGALPDDAIDKVTVLPNPYAVEFGRFSSGLVVIQTRRATDKWRLRVNQLDPSFRQERGTLLHIIGLASFSPRIELGGPLVKDKFFIENSFQYRYHANDVGSRPQDELVTSHRFSSFTRVDGAVSPRQSLTAVAGFFPSIVHDATLGTFTPPAATVDTHGGINTGAATLRSVWSNDVFTETTVEVNKYSTDVTPQGSAPMDLRPQQTFGNFFNSQYRDTRTYQFVETLSGSTHGGSGLHLYKLGLDFLHTDFDGRSSSGPVLISDFFGTLARELNFAGPTTQALVSDDFALFAQDRLQPSTRWYVEFGARLDRDGVIDRLNFTPRIGSAVLLNESGTAVVRAGYGRFFERTPSAAGAFDQYQSYTDTRYASDGMTPLGPSVPFPHVMSPDLRTARSDTWDVAYDQRFNKQWALHLGVIDRRGSNELLVNPVTTPTGSELLLESTGDSMYREAEIGVHYTAGDYADVNATYARSRARADLNAFTSFFDAVMQPVIGINQYAPSNSDVPNRLLARWRVHPTPRWLVFGILDWRNGLPYSNVNATLDFVGDRNSERFPTYFRLDLGVQRRIKMFGLRPWVGIVAENALNAWLPQDVQANLSSGAYGTFYNNEYRQFRIQVRFE